MDELTQADQIDRIEHDLAEIKETMSLVRELFDKVGPEILPLIEDVKQSPVLKMLGVKVKGKK